MSQISLQNLKKSFGKTQVIHDLSIDVKDGELIVIVGPSGCGKSTLLRMVAGLEDANEGNILIDNKKVNELEPMERNIAMVFQNYALYPHMTVFGNMAYGLKIAKVPKEEIESRVQKAAEILVASISGVVKEDTIGKNINLSIQDNKLHLFDTNTDLRIN